MTDNLGFGRDKRRALNLAILNGQTTFRDGFREMLDSVSERHSFQECQETLKKSLSDEALLHGSAKTLQLKYQYLATRYQA